MRKKICVIMTGLHTGTNSKVIEGISDQAGALDCDVYVYSFYENFTADKPAQLGAENILTLIDPDAFDGFIVYKGSFQNSKIREQIDALCCNSGKPFLDLDDPDAPEEMYPLWNDRSNFKKLVEHLITEHHCSRIYCVTGYQGFHQSENRLAGYRDALLAHGITPRSDYEFYGDFWKEHACHFADSIAKGEIPIPEAVAFAGTVPAKSFIERLSKHGIWVPEDIAVVGYDCTIEGMLSTPSITSIFHSSYNQGIHAMCRLHQLITGQSPQAFHISEVFVQKAESCGCSSQNNEGFVNYKQELSAQLEYQDMFRNSSMQQKISSAENLNVFFDRLMHLNYLIRGIRKVWCMLCDDWDGINNVEGDAYRSRGYSDELLTYMHSYPGGIVYSVVKREEIPDYIANKEHPFTYFFFPLHYEDRSFGFVCLEFYESCFVPDALFWNWLELVNNALETIRIRYYITRFSNRMKLTSIRDPLTGLYNRRGFEELSAEIYEYATIHQEQFLLIAIKLFNLREINESCGYKEGDRLILTMADAVNLSCTSNEVCCHVKAGLFYIIGSHGKKSTEKRSYAKKILAYCGKQLESIEEKQHIKIYIEGYAEVVNGTQSLQDIMELLDSKLSQRHRSRQKQITHLSNMADLRRAIYQNPQHRWTIEEMANAMSFSRAYFQRMYKKNFGISPAADVIAARTALAKKLLSGSRKSIKEIAEKCGYVSDFYFMQQFKKETGLTPLEFRKQNQ